MKGSTFIVFHCLVIVQHRTPFLEYNSCTGALFCKEGGNSCLTLFMVPARFVFFASNLFANDGDVKKLSVLTFLSSTVFEIII